MSPYIQKDDKIVNIITKDGKSMVETYNKKESSLNSLFYKQHLPSMIFLDNNALLVLVFRIQRDNFNCTIGILLLRLMLV